ncbi:TonB-dependent receptor plug domain-containing protein [Ectothiorhodospira lacustris]|uniref:TonB-dependent receptor plug domain-containing protein n=1 Tax=Ectothiorhodospira lacustris TaxID=2899127 RepID=UPI001EE9AD55|nr:TonB-dependent receptor [Ectothiorhodospira lacustris]MCG5509320.1 TonB-dependent receptor [Ectothiorhodospira lacustris]MCG5521374.1 TonB-dependent receptor [Ectothiorhodospira lacustris]
MTKMQRFLCIALLLPTGVPADTRTLSEQDFFMELPVALTATRMQQPQIEAPATVTIIDRDWLEHSNARHIADVLSMVPGFLVSHHDGNRRIVSYHGLGGMFVRQLQVLVDGRSIYSPTNGGAQWGDLALPLDDIERIEIVRGPNSAAYGSNSFFAIINILTRHAADTPGTQVRTRIGTHGVRDVSLRQGGSLGDRQHYRLSLSHAEDDGFPGNRDQWERTALKGRLDRELTGSRSLTVNAGLTHVDKGLETGNNLLIPSRDLGFRYGHLHAVLEGHADPDAGYRLQYYFEQYDLIDEYPLRDPASGLWVDVDQGVRNRRHDLEVEWHRQLDPRIRMVWGGGLREDAARSAYYFRTAGAVENRIQRLFANLEWMPAERWLLNLGGMYEANDLIRDEFMPRAALIFLPTSDLSLRLVASRAIRTPSLIESEIEAVFPTPIGIRPGEGGLTFIADEHIRAEVIQSLELGGHLLFDHGRGSLDIKAFHNEVDRLIQIPLGQMPADFTAVISNLGKLTIQGVEMQIDYRFNPHFRLSGGLSLLDSRSAGPDTRLHADSVPDHIFNLAGYYTPADAWTLSFQYYHHADVKWLDDPLAAPLGAGDGFLRLGLQRSLGEQAKIGLHVDDLLASGFTGRGADSPSWPANRRETRGAVSLQLNF